MIKGKSPEEIRKTFNIKNDFTEEEEAQVNILVTVVVMSRHVKLAARQVFWWGPQNHLKNFLIDAQFIIKIIIRFKTSFVNENDMEFKNCLDVGIFIFGLFNFLRGQDLSPIHSKGFFLVFTLI